MSMGMHLAVLNTGAVLLIIFPVVNLALFILVIVVYRHRDNRHLFGSTVHHLLLHLGGELLLLFLEDLLVSDPRAVVVVHNVLAVDMLLIIGVLIVSHHHHLAFELLLFRSVEVVNA